MAARREPHRRAAVDHRHLDALFVAAHREAQVDRLQRRAERAGLQRGRVGARQLQRPGLAAGDDDGVIGHGARPVLGLDDPAALGVLEDAELGAIVVGEDQEPAHGGAHDPARGAASRRGRSARVDEDELLLHAAEREGRPSVSRPRSPAARRRPSRNVPLRLPRSRSSQRPSVQYRLACSPETRGSSMRRSHARCRPIRQRGPSVNVRPDQRSVRPPTVRES